MSKKNKKKIIAESKIKRQIGLLRIAVHNMKAGLNCIENLERIANELENIVKQKDRVDLAPVKIYKYVYPLMRGDGTYPDPYSKERFNEIKPSVIFDDPDCLRIYLMGFPHEKMYL